MSATPDSSLVDPERVIADLRRELAERDDTLRTNEERYALVSQAVAEGVYDWDIENNALWVSPRLVEIFGLTRTSSVRNPLTTIAIFAGIAEISGTVVLPHIAERNQEIFVWFLILFPVLLVVAFFTTLNLNHRVLYAPSDYKNEDNFLRAFQTASPTERANKITEDIKEIENDSSLSQNYYLMPGPIDKDPAGVKSNLRASYLLAEELVITKLPKEFGGEVQRDARFEVDGRATIFDAMIILKSQWLLVEIKLVNNMFAIESRLRSIMNKLPKIRDMIDHLEEIPRLEVIVAIVSDFDIDKNRLPFNLDSLIADSPIPLTVRFYSMGELYSDLNKA
jgi:hypothetical protein